MAARKRVRDVGFDHLVEPLDVAALEALLAASARFDESSTGSVVPRRSA